MTRIIDDTKLDFKDVLLMPKRSELDSRSKVDLVRQYTFKHTNNTYRGIPILASNMDHTGTYEMARAFYDHQMGVALHKFYTVESLVRFFKTADSAFSFYSMGITDSDYEKFEAVWDELKKDDDNLSMRVCIDVANGYSRKFVSFVEKMRTNYPNLTIMAGNVVTPDMTYDLLERGADIVKIGIGPGSVCTTRKITGVGYPQLSAIMECADAAHGANGLICGDGGIVEAGDIAKGFAGGADFLMCGGLFAGHIECNGKVIGELHKSFYTALDHAHNNWFNSENHLTRQRDSNQIIKLPTGEQWIARFDNDGRVTNLNEAPIVAYKNLVGMKFYGMSSQDAMDKHYGGKASYRASEGKAVEVPYKGHVAGTVEEMLGGLRSACTYTGATTLKHLPRCTTFVRVNRILNDKFGT